MRPQRSKNITLSSPSPHQAGAIVDVIRAGFEREALDLTIYSSPRVGNWVAAHLRTPIHTAERAYTAAFGAGDMIGCIELAPHPDFLFLSYVSVLPEHRRRGVGSRLLGAAVRRSLNPGRESLCLDVFAENAPALDWYRKLGFQRTGTDLMCDASTMLPEPRVAGYVSGLPAAAAVQEAYGFSEFQVETRCGRTRVGQLADRWWRLAAKGADGQDVLHDRDLLSTLRALDPHRGLLLLCRGESPSDGATELFRTFRMEAVLDGLLGRLP